MDIASLYDNFHTFLAESLYRSGAKFTLSLRFLRLSLLSLSFFLLGWLVYPSVFRIRVLIENFLAKKSVLG